MIYTFLNIMQYCPMGQMLHLVLKAWTKLTKVRWTHPNWKELMNWSAANNDEKANDNTDICPNAVTSTTWNT